MKHRSYIKALISGCPRPVEDILEDKEQVDKAIAAATIEPDAKRG